MTDHTALGVGTARAWTRISTLSIDASQVAGTLAVTCTLWSTIRWRTDKVGQTGARRLVVDRLVN